MPFKVFRKFTRPISEIKTSAYLTPHGEVINRRRLNVIWDTGATNSFISEHAVNYYGLKPCRIVYQYHPDSKGVWDILIGMDIINLGDFSITHDNTETFFTFNIN